MTAEATVFVVDDNPAERETLAAIARDQGCQVRECESAETFLAEFRDDTATCVVVEAHLPDMSGSELQQRLKVAGKAAPVVMVSGRGDIRTAVQAMQQGAVTFLEKPCSAEELSSAIETALEQATRQQQAGQRQLELRERFARLTPSEREVLERVLEGQPNRQIAAEMDLGLRTVELRRSHIMKKTGTTNLSELIRLATEIHFPHDLPAAAAGKDDVAKSA